MMAVILSTPRSGSGYLAELLMQSPDLLHYIGEPFNFDLGYNDVADLSPFYARSVDNIMRSGNASLIKDNLSYIGRDEFDNQNIAAMINAYHKHISESFYIIKLIRRDPLQQALSACLAEITNIWYTQDGDISNPVNIPIEFLRQTLDIYLIRRRYLVNFQRYDEIVIYEDLTDDNVANMRLIKGLRHPDHEIETTITKNPDKSAFVANYDELLDWYNSNRDRYEFYK